MTKNLITTIGLGLVLTASSAFAASMTLTPGMGIATLTDNGAAFPGTLVTTYSSPLVNTLNPAETATVTERVYRVAGGTLDFFYQVTNTSAENDAFNTVDILNFTGFTTAVSYLTGNGGTVAPNGGGSAAASRGAAGNVINFFFRSAPPADGNLFPGNVSDWLEIDTNATDYTLTGSVGVIDGGVAQTPLTAPSPFAPTPEPVSMGLLGGGLALLGVARWRKAKKA